MAVSGGVDSVTLLDVLMDANQGQWQFIVAHFDHGIRQESYRDFEFVHELAAQYGLPFEGAITELGPGASEEEARRARYDFLYQVQAEQSADAILTAHHGDDRIETSLFNALRGGGRTGLAGLRSRPNVRRPLLRVDRADITQYARSYTLAWREDPTNQDLSLVRNRIRHQFIPLICKHQPDFKGRYQHYLAELDRRNQRLDERLHRVFDQHATSTQQHVVLPRHAVITAEPWFGKELTRFTIQRLLPDAQVLSPHIEQAYLFIKAGLPRKKLQCLPQLRLELEYDTVKFVL